MIYNSKGIKKKQILFLIIFAEQEARSSRAKRVILKKKMNGKIMSYRRS